MKVIKKGRPQKGWAQEFECTGKGNDGGGCEALLLVEYDDLFKTYKHYRDDKDTFVTFKCSECGVLTDIWGSNYYGERGKVEVPNISDLPDQSEWETNNKGK